MSQNLISARAKPSRLTLELLPRVAAFRYGDGPEITAWLRNDGERALRLVMPASLARRSFRPRSSIRTTRVSRSGALPFHRMTKPHWPGYARPMRALILALGRFDVASAQIVSDLEQQWRSFRREHGLDLEGARPPNKPLQPSSGA